MNRKATWVFHECIMVEVFTNHMGAYIYTAAEITVIRKLFIIPHRDKKISEGRDEKHRKMYEKPYRAKQVQKSEARLKVTDYAAIICLFIQAQ